MNCLAGKRVYKRLCGSGPRIAGQLGGMICMLCKIAILAY